MFTKTVVTVLLVERFQHVDSIPQLVGAGDVEILDRVVTIEAALESASRLRPDVVLVNLDENDDVDVLDMVAQLTYLSPRLPVVLAADAVDEERVLAALHAGAVGVVVRSAAVEELSTALFALASGWAVIPSFWATAAQKDEITAILARLKEPSVRLWRLLAEGAAVTEISRSLFVSDRTAKRMIAQLLRDLGVENRMQAAALAGRVGLASHSAESPAGRPGQLSAV
jgi:two-component system nitrate/nitrite response regulator NarL